MESNTQPTTEPQPPVQPSAISKQAPFWREKTSWAYLVVLALVVGGLTYTVQKQLAVSTSVPTQETPNDAAAGGVFLYMARNLELRLDDTWGPVPTSEILLPKPYSGALFALEKKGASCVLAYIRARSDSFEAYKGEERMFMVNNEHTRDQYIGYLNEGVLVTAYPRGFAGGNHQWPAGNDDDVDYLNAFVMYSPQAEVSLDAACVNDMETVMGQLRRHYDPVTLNAASDGVLYIVSEEVGGEEIDQVRFIPTGTTTSYTVMGLTATSRPAPQFAENKLYVVIKNELRTLDPFNRTSTSLQNIDLPAGETINSFWIEGHKVMYLAGVNCNSYKATCDLSLYEYDLDTSNPKKLAEHLSYRNILGYDPNTREILMAYVFADGGYRSENTGIYQYISGKIQKIESYESVEERFKGETPVYDYVLVREGQLFAPKEPLLTRENRWPITYRSQ
ncbi:MAG TPA: hypothetical protein VJK53_03415 [Candidatus Paceibacterota bacterium]